MAAYGVEKDVRYRDTLNIHEIHAFFEDMHCKKLIDHALKTLEKDPLFHASEKELTGQLPLEEIRHLTHLRMKKLVTYNFTPLEMIMENPLLGAYVTAYIGMLSYGFGLIARNALSFGVCIL